MHPSALLLSLPRIPGDPSASTIAQGVRCLANAAAYLYFHNPAGGEREKTDGNVLTRLRSALRRRGVRSHP